MTGLGTLRHLVATSKGRSVRRAGSIVAWILRRSTRTNYRPGVTVVTVNWNSLAFLRVTLDAIRAMSPRDTEIVVVDNGSSDGSIDFLRSRRDVRVMALPSNLGHGVALDLGVARVRTEYLAVLDVDAFPISDRWLPRVSKR